MYPIKFQNLYYQKIWGGRDFEKFRRNLPEGDIGESWDIACHANGIGIVGNGEYKGMTFDNLIKKYGHELVGTSISTEKFPLLVKLINAKENLSVQVHPGDDYAKIHENEFGKTEAWYVLDAKPGGKIIVGTKNCDKKIFAKAINEGMCEEYLNIIDVKKGDCFIINSGLVHSICKGVTIAEIQQNSDITYRVYDYGRPREIHVEKSLDVINFDTKVINLSNNREEEFTGFSRIKLCENKYFGMVKYNISDEWKDQSAEEKFHIITCVEGEGIIRTKSTINTIVKGDSIFMPAKLGRYIMKGNLEIIKSYPNVN